MTATADWTAVHPARPGAPLVLQGATLAEALGWTTTPPLPERMAETLDLLAQGLTHAQIGHRLGITADSAKRRVQRLYRRLDVHTRSACVYRAASLGLLPTRRGAR